MENIMIFHLINQPISCFKAICSELDGTFRIYPKMCAVTLKDVMEKFQLSVLKCLSNHSLLKVNMSKRNILYTTRSKFYPLYTSINLKPKVKHFCTTLLFISFQITSSIWDKLNLASELAQGLIKQTSRKSVRSQNLKIDLCE